MRTRRVVSFLLLLCFAFYGIEAEVADIHDSDADTAQLLSPDVSNMPGLRLPDPTDTEPVQDTHAFHVCHCSHTHTGVLPLVPQLTSIVVHSGDQLRFLRTSTSTLRLAPPLRPPIA